jgi:hypothetical protein
MPAVFLLATGPASAACHRYSIWHYPWPQRCQRDEVYPTKTIHAEPEAPLTSVKEIPLPFLTDIVWGNAPDEDMRGRLMLRAALSPP